MLCVLAFISSPHRPHYYLLPLEGVRGVELVTYSDVINIGLPIWEGLGRLLLHHLLAIHDIQAGREFIEGCCRQALAVDVVDTL